MTLSARVHWLLLAVHGSHWTCSERALTKRGFQSIIMSISVRRVRKTRYQSTSWEHDDVPITRSRIPCQAPEMPSVSGALLFRGRKGVEKVTMKGAYYSCKASTPEKSVANLIDQCLDHIHAHQII